MGDLHPRELDEGKTCTQPVTSTFIEFVCFDILLIPVEDEAVVFLQFINKFSYIFKQENNNNSLFNHHPSRFSQEQEELTFSQTLTEIPMRMRLIMKKSPE